jgi:hypothetical protein
MGFGAHPNPGRFSSQEAELTASAKTQFPHKVTFKVTFTYHGLRYRHV